MGLLSSHCQSDRIPAFPRNRVYFTMSARTWADRGQAMARCWILLALKVDFTPQSGQNEHR
jgi:hypothetical protein